MRYHAWDQLDDQRQKQADPRALQLILNIQHQSYLSSQPQVLLTNLADKMGGLECDGIQKGVYGRQATLTNRMPLRYNKIKEKSAQFTYQTIQ